jgi:hypothetical protein
MQLVDFSEALQVPAVSALTAMSAFFAGLGRQKTATG